MTLNVNELFHETSQAAGKRFTPTKQTPAKLASASGAPLLPQLTPMAKDAATGNWKVWSGLAGAAGAGTNEVQSIDLDTPTAGTFTISWDGETTAAIAYNATAATVQAALELLSNINVGDISVTGGPGDTTPFAVTFMGRYAKQNVPQMTLGIGSLTGGAAAAVTTTTAGVADPGLSDIKAFVYEYAGAQLHATDETLHILIMGGEIDARDVPLPSGESQNTLDAALRTGMRAKGFHIVGLTGVN